jgi:hypothetical protein
MSANEAKNAVQLSIESSQLAARLVACLPAATFEMETLCRLAGIKASREIHSAAVECRYRPRLLLNPDFIDQYCKRDEHLFLLVMHELWHVILAHTRLYPRATLAHNIAFDAIINAALARQFCAPEYRGFFEAINPADKFPSCLLRPPVGWPTHPEYTEVGPPGTRRLLERLYPPNNVDRWVPPLYEEILNLLRRDALQKMANGEVWIVEEPFLLGDHDTPTQSGQRAEDQFFKDVLKRVAATWPPPPSMPGRRSPDGVYGEWSTVLGLSTEQARRVFSRVLQRCLGPRLGRERRRLRAPVMGTTGVGVIPNARDRMVPARQQLGVQGVLWNLPGIIRARVPDVPSKAFIYLDVSGSMSNMLPYLLGLLLPYVSRGFADVFQFSTTVEPMPLPDIRKAQLRTTRGTDINCVLDHILATTMQIHRILILTDGYTGVPSDELIGQVKDKGLRVHIVLPAESAWTHDLEALANSMTVLPPVAPARSTWQIGP